jgi:hypothetical protein
MPNTFAMTPRDLSNLENRAHSFPIEVDRDPPNRTQAAIPLPTILPEKRSSCRVQRHSRCDVGIAEAYCKTRICFRNVLWKTQLIRRVDGLSAFARIFKRVQSVFKRAGLIASRVMT